MTFDKSTFNQVDFFLFIIDIRQLESGHRTAHCYGCLRIDSCFFLLDSGLFESVHRTSEYF